MSRHLFNLVVISTILFQLPISLFESVIDIVDGAVSSYYFNPLVPIGTKINFLLTISIHCQEIRHEN